VREKQRVSRVPDPRAQNFVGGTYVKKGARECVWVITKNVWVEGGGSNEFLLNASEGKDQYGKTCFASNPSWGKGSAIS